MFFQVNCHELCGETAAATETRVKHAVQRAVAVAPCLLLLRNVHVLGRDRDGNADGKFYNFVELKLSNQVLYKLTLFCVPWGFLVS